MNSKKMFPNFILTVVAGLLISRYFFEMPEWFINLSNVFLAAYVVILILSIVVALLVFFISWVVHRFHNVMEKDILETLMATIDSMYTAIGEKKTSSIIYSPVFSLLVIFFSFQTGMFFLMAVEAISEFLNLNLIDRAKNYLDVKRELSENE